MDSAVLATTRLGFQWPTIEPFLFCVHHNDPYPKGNADLGPAASLAGRRLGMDFEGRDGWRMYHGRTVPGFPRHPHRGFETVTVVQSGLIDHTDSLGAAARYGDGDVQWMTAGSGIVHAEMFPLLRQDDGNPVDFFQLWLNLPRERKMARPHFKMMWAHTIPEHRAVDAQGRETRVTVVAGPLAGAVPPAPPPDSWAADPANGVAIWSISMASEASWTLPAGPAGANRMLYRFTGGQMVVDGQVAQGPLGMRLRAEADVVLRNGAEPSRLLLLQARPIGEPVVQHGPFVMCSHAEIRRAFEDYQRTGFGGWPWRRDDPIHSRGAGRFATHADGRREEARAPASADAK